METNSRKKREKQKKNLFKFFMYFFPHEKQ